MSSVRDHRNEWDKWVVPSDGRAGLTSKCRVSVHCQSCHCAGVCSHGSKVVISTEDSWPTLAPSINNSAAEQTSKGDSTKVIFCWVLLWFVTFGSSSLQNNENNVSFRISTNCKPSCYYIQCWVVASLSSQQLDWPAKSHHNPPVPCPSISPFMCSSMSSPLTRAPSQQFEGAVNYVTELVKSELYPNLNVDKA